MVFSLPDRLANSPQSDRYRFSPLARSRSNGWIPFTLRPLVLATVCVVALAIIAILQILSSISQAKGGLAFTSVGYGNFTVAQSFAYLYVPIIVSVTLSMTWTWFDLDMKRIEPYLQMSKSGGATARESILLRYPFEFVAVAPFKAFRQRHWSVFVTSIITLLFYWGITPLQGTLLSTKIIATTQDAVFSQLATVDSLAKSQSSLGSQYLANVWSMVWFGQTLPSITSRNGTILPFDTGSNELGSDYYNSPVDMVIPTSFLYTKVNCTPAVQSKSNTTHWSTGSGCDIDLSRVVNNKSQTEPVLAYGLAKYFVTDNQDESILVQSRQGCDNLWFGVWKEDAAHDLGAVFCQPEYLSQTATATIDQGTFAFKSADISGDIVDLSERGFNATDYEYLISNGYSNVLDTPQGQLAALNASDSSPLDVSGRLGPLKVNTLSDSTSTAIAFAIGATPNNDVQSLLSQDGFIAAVSRMHNWTFAVAASQMLGPPQSGGMPFAHSLDSGSSSLSRRDQTSLNVQYRGVVQALVVNQVQVHVVQALLALIITLIVLLIFLNHGRTSNLDSDPNSLTALAALVNPEESSTIMRSLQFHLLGYHVGAIDDFSTSTRYHLTAGPSGSEIKAISPKIQPDGEVVAAEPAIGPAMIRDIPFLLSRTFGSIVVMLLTAAIVGLAAVKVRSDGQENSLALPHSSLIGQTIILSYLPVVFATLVEQVWIFLNRSLCLLQPFDELRGRKVTAKKSILTRYASLPPQLNILRATGSRHFMLALVCLATISSNLLAISLSDLFRRMDVYIHSSREVFPQLSRNFKSNAVVNNVFETGGLHTGGNDIFYLFQPDVDPWEVRLPWTWLGTFYTPYNIQEDQIPASAENLNVETYGFSISPGCMDIDELDKSTSAFNFTISNSGDMTFSLNISEADLLPKCGETSWQSEGVWSIGKDGAEANGGAGDGQNDAAKPVAMEGVYLLVPPDNRACEPLLLGMYLRNLTVNAGVGIHYDLDNATSEHSSFFVCNIDIHVDSYNTTVLRNGDINGAVPTLIHDAVDFFPGNASEASAAKAQLVQNITRLIIQEPVDKEHVAWLPHFTVSSMQWVTYLIADMATFGINSWDTADPSAPAPPASQLTYLAEDLIGTLGSFALSINQDALFEPAPQQQQQQRRTLFSRDSDDSGWTPSQPTPGPTPTANSRQLVVRQLESRVVIDVVKFPLAIALLVFHLVIAIIFYMLAPKQILDSLPTTIASQLLFFAGSTLLVSARQRRDATAAGSGRARSRSLGIRWRRKARKGTRSATDGENSSTALDDLSSTRSDEDNNYSYGSWSDDLKVGYGRFRGTDGVLRTGIERAQLVSALPAKGWSGQQPGREHREEGQGRWRWRWRWRWRGRGGGRDRGKATAGVNVVAADGADGTALIQIGGRVRDGGGGSGLDSRLGANQTARDGVKGGEADGVVNITELYDLGERRGR